ncbi:MAG: isochorismatase family protein [Williamsia herbipolensis]|nr:isochorismatase family protein [Williamsia herbipolensis]
MTQQYTPDTGLVVVDMQHDFADPSGALYVRGGEQLAAPIGREVEAATAAGAVVVFTQDWHRAHTPHFAQDGGIWPVHCVHDTPGAELVPGLLPSATTPDHLVRKGSGTEDGYSGFSVVDLTTDRVRGTELSTVLDENGIMRVVVVGLAGDWCVAATAVDGVRLGYDVTVPLTLTRFVELEPGHTDAALGRMTDAGVTLVGDPVRT